MPGRPAAAFVAVAGAMGLVLLAAAAPARAASLVEIVNLDGPGEGLNDPAPFTPAGGNDATTLGQARLRAVEAAAAVWAENLTSSVPIRLGVGFDPLGGTANEATLGFGGAEDVFRDFAGAPRSGTWYPAALADRLAGLDLAAPGALDLAVTFNSDVDADAVLGATRFYYGFDGKPPAGDVELLEVAVHELAHGLGVATYLDLASGAKLLGYDDAYLVHVERHGGAPADFPSMSDGQRQAALGAGSEVHWTGADAVAVAAAAGLTAGVGAGGHLELYAPSPPEPGSSLAHLSPAFAPDQVLEPFYVGAVELDRGLGLTLALLADLGWGPETVCATLAPPGPDVTVDDGDAGYAELAGSWESRSEGFDGDARVSNDPEAQARFSFSGLSPGRQEVFVHLPGDPAAAPAARYTVSSQGDRLLTALQDQALTAGWVSLGVVETAGAELEVEVEPGGRMVAVINPSFEAVALADGTWRNGATTGWSVYTSTKNGIQNLKDQHFPGATDGDATPSAVPDGLNTAYSNGGRLFQVLGATLEPGVVYTLSVEVGRRLDIGFPGYQVQLLAGGVILAAETSLTPGPGQFATSVVTYQAPPGSPQQGQPLEIRLISNATQTNFDLVRFTADHALWADAVRVEERGPAPAAPQIDDGEPGYQEEDGAWRDEAVGTGGASRAATSAGARASYAFTGLTPGLRTLEVYLPRAGEGGEAVYTVAAGGSPLASFTTDQGDAPGGWQALGEVNVDGPAAEVIVERGASEAVAVTNPSFEAVAVADGSWKNGNTTGWTMIGSAAGIFNPRDSQFPGATDGDATPSTIPDGLNTGHSGGGTLSQLTGVSLTADTLYTLTVEVGRRLDSGFPGYQVQLLAGGMVLAEESSPTPSPGEFLTATVTYFAAADDPFLGHLLEIRLHSDGQQTNFDDVRLTATRPLQADAVLLRLP